MHKGKLEKIIKKIKVQDESYSLMEDLYPICRSITGNGVRKTLKILKKKINLKIFEIPSGTKAFDWNVPLEWNIRDAYVKNLKGERIIDFKKSNIHVLNYSIPINKKVTQKELIHHLHTLPNKPNSIPYTTSYYKKNWGFCVAHNQLKSINDDPSTKISLKSTDPSSFQSDIIASEINSKEEIMPSSFISIIGIFRSLTI